MDLRRSTVVEAPPETVFRVLEQYVVGAITRETGHFQEEQAPTLHAGLKFSCQTPRRGNVAELEGEVTQHQSPHRIAFLLGDSSQRIHSDFIFRHQPGGDTTELSCHLSVSYANPLRAMLVRSLRWIVARRLEQQLEALRRLASGVPEHEATLQTGRGLWHRPQDRYRGLLAACAPGMHAKALKLLLSEVQPGGAVLDLGAGSGAWLARLRDAGFDELSAIELNRHWFRIDGVAPLVVDLNCAFADDFDQRFRLVTALEIIEHLDNPRRVLREVHRLLHEDGYLLVTTPNISHWAGRLHFLRSGEHRSFGEWDYRQRHISPMTDLHMSLMLRECGFRLLVSTTAGSFDGRLRRILIAPIAGLFRLLLGPRAVGDVSIYLATRDTPYAGLGTDSRYLLDATHRGTVDEFNGPDFGGTR